MRTLNRTVELVEKHKNENSGRYKTTLQHQEMVYRMRTMEEKFKSILENQIMPRVAVNSDDGLLKENGIKIVAFGTQSDKITIMTKKVFQITQLRVIVENSRYQIPREAFDDDYLELLTTLFDGKTVTFYTQWKWNKAQSILVLSNGYSSIPTPHITKTSICLGSHEPYINNIRELTSYTIYMLWAGMEKVNANSLLQTRYTLPDRKEINLKTKSIEFVKRHPEFEKYIIK